MPIISIIVPVYNVQSYLRKCIDSLLAQDYDDYEIILVDDGSTDESSAICDEYGMKAERGELKVKNIRVIHQPNAGLSEARNSGIRAAGGKYIMFVDSDDYIEAGVIQSLVVRMQRDDLDVLRFNYQNVNEQGEVFNPNKSFKPFVDYRDEVCDGLTFLNERLGTACYVVQFIVRRELVPTFTRGIYFEDVDWTPRMLLQAKRVTSIDTVVYNYLLRQGSITQNSDLTKKRKALNDRLTIIGNLHRQAQAVSDRRWFDGMVSTMIVSILATIAELFYEERRAWLDRIKALGVYPLSYFHLTKSAKRKAQIINVSPSLYCLLMHLKGK
ncbi:MAG: glycosyltransferase [Paludibacteraceae bacterium]|nr:glycosyltransferase [Paludibacteraceae bacterium]